MKNLKHLQTFENFRVDEGLFGKTKKEDLKEESKFLETEKGKQVSELHKKGESKRIPAITTPYAIKELGKTSNAASDFTKNVLRILDGRISELDKPLKGGRGAASGAA